MPQQVDLVNRALQTLGTRTTVTATELAGNATNEAIQASIAYDNVRQSLLRMAPWDCAFNTIPLTLITAVQGTPENTGPIPATQLWQKGLPAPPWAYEYQYPADCLRACWIMPQYATGFAGGVPITTAVTGGTPSFWSGQPVRFKVGIDQFVPVIAATVVSGGTGHAVGDIITLASGPTTLAPIGAPAQLGVLTVGGGGAVATVGVVSVNRGETGIGGSYFAQQPNPVAQGSTTGSGTGATFNLTYGPKGDQRVILTNQEFAIMNYVRDVTDVNVFDDKFYAALSYSLGAALTMALTGDKALANIAVGMANQKITEARAVDGNEGLTVNDVTPDWIRIRGVWYTEYYSGPYGFGYEWGTLWPAFG